MLVAFIYESGLRPTSGNEVHSASSSGDGVMSCAGNGDAVTKHTATSSQQTVGKNVVMKLNEWSQKKRKEVKFTGEQRDNGTWQVQVLVENSSVEDAFAEGATKQEAKTKAVEKALRSLGIS